MKTMTRKGAEGGAYKPLDEEGVKKIHDSAMKIFSDTGIQVKDEEARAMFKAAGASVDEDTCIAKIPCGLVQEIIREAPSIVTLYGRDESGELDCEIGGRKVYMGTGGTALNVQEPGSDENRPSELRDIRDLARVVDKLDNIHFYMLNVYPNDIESGAVDVNRFGAALNNTRKHVMGGVYSIDGIRNVVNMASKIAGSEQALREKPFISMVTCVISPFVIDKHYGRLTMEVAKSGIPVVVPTEPLCGATSPITLAGNLVIQVVDSLAGVMLAQLARKGAPTIFGSVASITDLREMKYLAGAVEMGLLNAATAQMAQFYELPYYATAGMTDSKVPDAQAGYESAITSVMVALSGANYIHDAAGFIEFCMTVSYDKLVIDDEIIGMVMRAVEGITVDDSTIAMDEIAKVGPGGHFVSSRHTRKHMRKEQFLPELSNREDREAWLKNGALDARQRATARVKAILEAERVPQVPTEVRKWIKHNIPGIHPVSF